MSVLTLDKVTAGELPDRLKALGIPVDQELHITIVTELDRADSELEAARSIDEVAAIVSRRAAERGLTDQELERLLADD